VDPIDEIILGILQQDGRASFSDLGRQVGLSTNAAAARVRKLEATGVILGYRAVLAAEAPGAPVGIETFIDVRLLPGQDSDDFLAWARSERLIAEAIHLTGPYDYLVRARVHDTAELDRLLHRMKSGAGVAQTQTRIALGSPGEPGQPRP